MIAVLIILGFVAIGIVAGFIATATAPSGYEDESGFHYGPERAATRAESNREVTPTRPHLAKAVS